MEWLRDFIAATSAEESVRIGRYEIISVLGEGGSAVVYEAYDPELDRRVALKVLRLARAPGLTSAPLPSTDEATRRLRREAQTVARLRHLNIVTVHEVGDDYLAMELIEGRTFGAALPNLSLEERVSILEVVARAVAYAHEHGVVHRDLKPSNILIEAGGRVVLTDFGIAKLADAEILTRHDRAVGTPQYMAPEQVRGEAAGPAADIWALGVLLYEALTGVRPFAAAGELALYDQITRARPAPPPGPLGAVAMRALEKRSDQRYSSASALADELERWRRGDRPHARRRRLRRAHVLSAIGALVTLGLGLAWRATKTPPHGLTGQYFAGKHLSGTAKVRTDKQIDFLWPLDEAPQPGIPASTFSVRWRGRLRAEHTEPTRLCVRSDDGQRLWIDGELVIDAWDDHSSLIECRQLDLVRGRYYTVRLEYFQTGHRALVELWWESPSISPPEVVPARALFAPEGDSS